MGISTTVILQPLPATVNTLPRGSLFTTARARAPMEEVNAGANASALAAKATANTMERDMLKHLKDDDHGD